MDVFYIKKHKKIRRCARNEMGYITARVVVVADNDLLQLRSSHGFYNTVIFKIKHKLQVAYRHNTPPTHQWKIVGARLQCVLDYTTVKK